MSASKWSIPASVAATERNVVVTLWDWGTELDGRTDSTPADVRDGTVNANGLGYGRRPAERHPGRRRSGRAPREHDSHPPSRAPRILTDTPESPYYGDDPIWARASDPRSVAMDGEGRVWLTGRIRGEDAQPVRLELGDNPPLSCIAEVYTPPPTVVDPPPYGSGGLHLTRDGVAWQDWRGSGHFASFDRSQCADTSDPTAGGQSCPEGWTFQRMDKPTYSNAEMPINSDESYLTQIDHHDVLGFGPETPVYGVVNTDSLEVFVPATGEFVTLRVPYPMGFFSRSSVGRIDDPATGWKGRGLWSSYSNYAAWHLEGGPGTLQKAVKFQVRPHPLAK